MLSKLDKYEAIAVRKHLDDQKEQTIKTLRSGLELLLAEVRSGRKVREGALETVERILETTR